MRRVAITLLVILTFGCLSAVYVAQAEVSSNPFDETYVLNDLNGAEINNKIRTTVNILLAALLRLFIALIRLYVKT